MQTTYSTSRYSFFASVVAIDVVIRNRRRHTERRRRNSTVKRKLATKRHTGCPMSIFYSNWYQSSSGSNWFCRCGRCCDAAAAADVTIGWLRDVRLTIAIVTAAVLLMIPTLLPLLMMYASLYVAGETAAAAAAAASDRLITDQRRIDSTTNKTHFAKSLVAAHCMSHVD